MNKLMKSNYFYPPKPHSTFQSSISAVKSFKATNNGMSSENAHNDVVLTYASMLQACIPPDPYIFPGLLKACASLSLRFHGILFHQQVVVRGYSSDSYIASSLINFYGKVGLKDNAHKVFELMPERNVVSWTAFIGCYSLSNDVNEAFYMYNLMQREGIRPSSVTVLAVLSTASELIRVESLHACGIKYGFVDDITLMNSMLHAYGKCGRIQDTRYLFELMDVRDVVSWNSMFSTYALAGNVEEISMLLRRMRFEGVEPDQHTYGSLVSVTNSDCKIEVGKSAHGQIITAGLGSDAQLETSIAVMYLRCGNTDDALRLFEQSQGKDMILWTAMISGLVQNDLADQALIMFRSMLSSRVMLSTATIASVLAACAQLGSLNMGTSIHCYILRHKMLQDIAVLNSLITMYAKCGCLEQSTAVFSMMDEKGAVSWNAIIAAYAQNGYVCKTLNLFNEMRETHARPDSVTIVSLLQTCAMTGAYHQGKWIHSFVIRCNLETCILISTALVDMYSKCGDLSLARKCFDKMQNHDLISWSSIIAGYGSYGKGETAFELFSEFLKTGFEPNHVIFLSILCACSHNGLVDRGLCLFHSMVNDYGIAPKFEHCACIVDLLCRAGRIEDAYKFYKRAFPEPMADILGILLDACRNSHNTELADNISNDIFKIKPTDAGNYLHVAHSYASSSRWKGVGDVWVEMRSLGLKKPPGWSFVDLHGEIVTFYAGHFSHPRYEDVLSVLKALSREIRKPGINSLPAEFAVDSDITWERSDRNS